MKVYINHLKTGNGRQNLFKSLILGLIISFGSYSFAIASTTLSISETKSHNQAIQQLQTEIAELEGEYFAIINTLSLSEAEMYGLTETPSIHFAHIKQDIAVAYNF
jgi:hypothetical protein